jgi:hypothetical protein
VYNRGILIVGEGTDTKAFVVVVRQGQDGELTDVVRIRDLDIMLDTEREYRIAKAILPRYQQG